LNPGGKIKRFVTFTKKNIISHFCSLKHQHRLREKKESENIEKEIVSSQSERMYSYLYGYERAME
jgi:hypothetical protein